MISRLLQVLHRHPISSTAVLFVGGIAIIFAIMVFLSQKTNEEMAEQYEENYIGSLNEFQKQYSSKIVSRLGPHGIHTSSDYQNEEGSIPFPATFSIELAESLTDPGTGIETRLYSDFPFRSRTDGGPRAKAMFERVLEELPEDSASKSYIKRCDRYLDQELPEDWDGSLDFDFK